MKTRRPFAPSFWATLLAALLLAGAVILVLRFTRGLGAVTNMSDAFPWGLWVGFDILCGVGLAAGGFTITSAVYIFNVKRFKPIVRPTVLTAFLGYVLVVTALLFDIGRPWNLWRPLVFWNPRSVMFEVAWCVTLYLTVLALEFSGVVFERLGWEQAARVQKSVTVPLVLAGAILSTLHQSSLGSFYLIVPEKLHPLWYTPYLPVMFFLSAIAAGLAMVVVESRLSSKAFGHRLEMPLLSEVGRVLLAALGVYGVARIYDLVSRHAWRFAFEATPEAGLFLLEFLGGVVLPFVLLTQPSVRRHGRRLYIASLFVVLGFVTHRLNVSITGLERAQGVHYVPALPELLITLMLVAVGFGIFRLAVTYLPIYPHEAEASLPIPAGATAAADLASVPTEM
jgi:Ni/Fe-hydrogenase subunit HybB-like protein